MTVTSNGSARAYSGRVSSSAPISGLGLESIEGGDRVTNSGNQISYQLTASEGFDAFSFSTNAQPCLALDTNLTLFWGEDPKVRARAGLNLATGAACTVASPPSGGNTGGGSSSSIVGEAPSANANNPGLYVWTPSSGSNSYTLRATSKDRLRRFSGVVETDRAMTLQAGRQLESHDVVTLENSGRRLRFDLRVWEGMDQLGITVPATGKVCLKLDSASSGPLRRGRQATVTDTRVDLRTLAACQ